MTNQPTLNEILKEGYQQTGVFGTTLYMMNNKQGNGLLYNPITDKIVVTYDLPIKIIEKKLNYFGC